MYRTVAAVALIAGTWPTWAQDIDPNACFCLKHAEGQFQRGCHADKFPGQFFQTAFCLDPEDPDITSETLIRTPWTVVMEGEEGCEICRPDRRETEDVPRGEEEEGNAREERPGE